MRDAWLRPLLGACIVVAVIVHLPALRVPLAADDFVQRAMVAGKAGAPRGPLNLYDFVGDDNRAAFLDRGAIAWWNDANVTIRFLRPLPSLLVWLDDALFGDRAFYPHVHSLLWWGAAVFGAYWLFRRTLSYRAAVFATAVFALSACHTIPILWLANRDALVTAAIGAWALGIHVRWRDDNLGRDAALSGLAWAATMLTGEYALSFAGYVLAMELFRHRETIRRRLVGVATFAVPAAVYLAARAARGYDVRGSGFYRNPLEHPGSFLLGAPRATAVLLGSAFCGIDERLSAPASSGKLAVIGAGAGLAIALSLSIARRTGDLAEGRAAARMTIGALLALLPVLAADPSARLLAVPSLGAAAAIAVILDAAVRAAMERSASGPSVRVFVTWVAAMMLLVRHFVVVPGEAYPFARDASITMGKFERRLDWLRARRGDAASTVLVLRAVDSPLALLGAPFMLGDAAPARWRVLGQTRGHVVATRAGPRTLRLAEDDRSPLIAATAFMRPDGFESGEVVDVPGMRATIERLDAGGEPAQIRYDFDRDLDDPSLTWLAEDASGFREVRPPPPNLGMRL